MIDSIIENYYEEEFLKADGFDTAIIGVEENSMRLIFTCLFSFLYIYSFAHFDLTNKTAVVKTYSGFLLIRLVISVFSV